MEKGFTIRTREEYKKVFDELAQYGTNSGSVSRVKFIIYYEDANNVDKELLLYYYLIANYYKNILFSLEVHVNCRDCSEKQAVSAYFSICSFAYIQYNSPVPGNQRSSKVFFHYKYNRTVSRDFQRKELNGLQKHLPVITVDRESYRFLKSPVKDYWNMIKQYKQLELNEFKNIVLYLCGNALFGETNHKQLTRIRILIFGSSLFEKGVSENTILSLLIFSLYDSHLRMDLTKKYYERLGKPKLKELHFFKEFQSGQNRVEYEEYLKTVEAEGDIKTFLKKADTTDIEDVSLLDAIVKNIHSEMKKRPVEDYRSYMEEDHLKSKEALLDQMQQEWLEGKTDNQWINEFTVKINNVLRHYDLHPQIIKELYEAVIISEGILQLIENTVYHAGIGKDDGCGVMDMRILNIENDEGVISSHYDNKNILRKYKNRYWMLINIADISMTNITEKFYENNKEIIEKIGEETPEMGITLSQMTLCGFFRPDESQREAWNTFYNYGDENDRAVNHFGLQIFDSIVNSKGGVFMASSGEDSFDKQNMLLKIPGTFYRILLPLDEKSIRDDNSFDMMLGYNIQNGIKKIKEVPVVCNPCIKYIEPIGLKEKESYIKDIAYNIGKVYFEDSMFCQFSLADKYNLECLIKGILLFVFRKNQKRKLNFVFVNCEQYQILEIVRLIALYYDRQEQNRKMENVQIYVKGREIGEELLLYGETLTDLRDNLALSACVKGTMYQNLNVINTILSRRKPK